MEDALAQIDGQDYLVMSHSLNPCCNGRCTRTNLFFWFIRRMPGLNPCCNGRCTRTDYKFLTELVMVLS